MKPIVLTLALAAAIPSAFAAGPSSVGPYRSSSVIGVEDARLGEVLMAREIQMEPSRKANVGSVVGASVGYGAARKVKGDYRNAARVAGGVLGGVAGTAIQNSVSHRKAYEVYVRELSGKGDRVVVLIHEGDLGFREGDRVFLVGKGNKTRLVPIPPPTLSEESKLPQVACGWGGCTNSKAEDGPWNGTTPTGFTSGSEAN